LPRHQRELAKALTESMEGKASDNVLALIKELRERKEGC